MFNKIKCLFGLYHFHVYVQTLRKNKIKFNLTCHNCDYHMSDKLKLIPRIEYLQKTKTLDHLKVIK